MLSFANMFCVLLTYLIEIWISPGSSYEFNVVYVQREKFSIYYTTAAHEVHFQEQK